MPALRPNEGSKMRSASPNVKRSDEVNVDAPLLYSYIPPRVSTPQIIAS